MDKDQVEENSNNDEFECISRCSKYREEVSRCWRVFYYSKQNVPSVFWSAIENANVLSVKIWTPMSKLNFNVKMPMKIDKYYLLFYKSMALLENNEGYEKCY